MNSLNKWMDRWPIEMNELSKWGNPSMDPSDEWMEEVRRWLAWRQRDTAFAESRDSRWQFWWKSDRSGKWNGPGTLLWAHFLIKEPQGLEKRAVLFLRGCGEHRWEPSGCLLQNPKETKCVHLGLCQWKFLFFWAFLCFQADHSLSCEMFWPQIRI